MPSLLNCGVFRPSSIILRFLCGRGRRAAEKSPFSDARSASHFVRQRPSFQFPFLMRQHKAQSRFSAPAFFKRHSELLPLGSNRREKTAAPFQPIRRRQSHSIHNYGNHGLTTIQGRRRYRETYITSRAYATSPSLVIISETTEILFE